MGQNFVFVFGRGIVDLGFTPFRLQKDSKTNNSNAAVLLWSLLELILFQLKVDLKTFSGIKINEFNKVLAITPFTIRDIGLTKSR